MEKCYMCNKGLTVNTGMYILRVKDSKFYMCTNCRVLQKRLAKKLKGIV